MVATQPDAQPKAACRLCGGASVRSFYVGDRNRGLGSGRFEYRRCSACGATFMPTVPNDLGAYYATDGYGSVSQHEDPRFVRGEEAKLALVSRYAQGNQMIEIGPGPGMFTRVAVRAGYDVIAVDMDVEYCRQLHELLGVRAIASDDPAEVMPTLPRADAVVMWHVVEHLADPWRVLRSCVENLKPGGVIAISTPNPSSLQFWLLKRYWAHVDAPRHLQLIPHETLKSRLAALGMQHVLTATTDPVGLDCNRLGWEFAVRRHPARRPSTGTTMRISGYITSAASRIEHRGLHGATYTSLFLLPSGETGERRYC